MRIDHPARDTPSAIPPFLSMALALSWLPLAASAVSPAPAPACAVSTPAGAFDLAPLGTVRHTTPTGWTYLFSACADVDASAGVSGSCGGVAPAPAVQVTGGECHSLGRLAQRSIAPLAKVGVVGLTVAFDGGDACGNLARTISIDVACADVERASKAQVIESTTRACSYNAAVESRAGCPLSCARDPKTGAVCGGKRRGACTMAVPGGAVACVCVDGYEGPICEPTAETAAAAAVAAAAAAAAAGESAAPQASSSAESTAIAASAGFVPAAFLAALAVAALAALRAFRRSAASTSSSTPPLGLGARGATLFLALGALLYALAADSQLGLLRGVTVAPSVRLALAPVASAAGVAPAAAPVGGCSIHPQRLALFNAVPYHTDVFGFLLDFCRDCNHSCAVYHGATAYSALPAYSIYYAPLELRDAARFEGEQKEFAAVFMITPNDRALSAEMRQAEVHRFVYVTHLTEPGLVMRWMLLRIYTTPLAGVPYALPFFAGLAPQLASARTRSIVFVGSIHSGENVLLSDVGAISGRLVDLGFAVTLFASYIRASDAEHAAFRANGGAKAVIREGAGTEELHEAVGRASFMLLFPNEDSWYVMDRVTGAHLMAVGLGTPILTTSQFASIYGLGPETSGTLSGDGPAEMAEAVALFDAPAKYARLVAAASAFRARQVLHNREAIESVLQYVPGIGGSGGASATLPLSENLRQRVIPRKGDP
jgi:hypothetical protein